MARNVNQWITNWRWTGDNVPTPQAEVDVHIEWIADDGESHEWEGTVTFPNDLQLVPVAWVCEVLEELVVRALRKRLEMD
ncbi:MAG: hypothetical protein KAT00_03405 [Planctomycetes bacterium]|nr:hypothetical protein [Planctomycetota bacterium]